MSIDSLDSDLEAVYLDIMAATRPEDVFGQHRNSEAVTHRFKELATVLDPERYTRLVDANASADARTELIRLYEAASRLDATTVIETITLHSTPYRVTALIGKSEHTVLYKAQIGDRNDDPTVVLKIARNPVGNDRIRREREYLQFFASTNDRHPIARVRRTLPRLLEASSVAEREVLVLPDYSEYRSVATIIDHFAGELPIGHAAWIARRVLAFPLTAELVGVHHHAISGDHLLVHPISHEPIYLGWGHATPARPEAVSTKDVEAALALAHTLFTDPREPTATATLGDYLAKQRAHSATVSMRAVFTEFTELVYATLGKHYQPLHLN